MYPEASFEMTQGAFQDESQADARLYVKFGLHPHLNQDKTSKEGRPIYEEKVYIMIMVPGDKDSIVHRPAWDKDFRRFPKQYQAFLNNKADAIVGTPLNHVPWLTGSQIKELEFFNIVTVEQLANVPDVHLKKYMGLQSLKQRAADFLEAAKGAAPLLEMRKELENRDALITQLTKRLEALETKETEEA